MRIETCAGSWLIDAAPSPVLPGRAGHAGGLRAAACVAAFHSLLVGDAGLARLVLDERGLSALSGWLHADDCLRCAQAARKLA